MVVVVAVAVAVVVVVVVVAVVVVVVVACGPARAPAPTSPPLGQSQWTSTSAGSTGGCPGWTLVRPAREPSECRASRVDASTCLQDEPDEVVLVGVLRRVDRGLLIPWYTYVVHGTRTIEYHGSTIGMVHLYAPVSREHDLKND